MAESEEQRAALEKLDRLADEIDSLLYLKPESFRLSVAKKLVEARQTVTAAGLGWYAWTRTNIDRSQGEIRRLLEIGAAPDPQQALDRFRE